VATAGFSNLKDGTKISLGDGKKPKRKPSADGKKPEADKKPRKGKLSGSGGLSASGTANAAPLKTPSSKKGRDKTAPAVSEGKAAGQKRAKPQKQAE
jgi:hypothetical protein